MAYRNSNFCHLLILRLRYNACFLVQSISSSRCLVGEIGPCSFYHSCCRSCFYYCWASRSFKGSFFSFLNLLGKAASLSATEILHRRTTLPLSFEALWCCWNFSYSCSRYVFLAPFFSHLSLTSDDSYCFSHLGVARLSFSRRSAYRSCRAYRKILFLILGS